MSNASHIDSNSQFINSKTTPKKRLRKHVHIMFIGLSSEETAPIIALLRASRLSPRGKHITDEQTFLAALSDHSWDLILCTEDRGDFGIKTAIPHLNKQNKDIPIIQLIAQADCKALLQGMRNKIQAVAPLAEKELLLCHIRRELENLDQRRRLRRAESALAEVNQRNYELMHSSQNPICCCNDDSIIFANEAFVKCFGFTQEAQLLGSSLSSYFVLEEQEELQKKIENILHGNASDTQIELTALRSDLTEFSASMQLSPARVKGRACVRVFFDNDIDADSQLLSENLDLVSGLFNNEHLCNQLERTIHRSLHGGSDCTLIYIILDQYDQILQSHGIEFCDQLIRDCSNILRAHISNAHLISRSSDNVFSVIYLDPNLDKAESLAQILNKEFSDLLKKTAGENFSHGCSIGLATINDNTPPQEELIARAALTARSLSGTGGYKVYAKKDEAPAQQQALESLDNAINNNQLRLLFQPVVHLINQTDTGQHYEVLLRLIMDDGTEVSPDVFMNAIYDPEISIRLDRWVIEQSLCMLVPTLENPKKNYLFLNLSLPTLSHKQTLGWLAETLRKHDIPADRLIFQISVNDIRRTPKKAHIFSEELHKMHCHVCIKHFSTSEHSISSLKQVQSDYIKLDGKIVESITSDKKNDESFYNLTQQLNSLKKKTIAPQIEDTGIMAKLWKARISFIQGYYLQKPRKEMDYDFFEDN